jgi:uncharacterized protein (DUF433 family)
MISPMRKAEPSEYADAVFGVGSYTAPEAARLLNTAPINIRRWMRGYSFGKGGKKRQMPPLWQSQIPVIDEHVEIGFRDLIELRFVTAFIGAGVGLKAIRNCLDYARELVQEDRPFATRRFQTDGRTIFLESINKSGDSDLLDLKKHQYVLKQVIARTFRDLDIEDDVVARWRPFHGKASIVIDPERSFGQPIAVASGVPTATLADAVEAEGSIARVSDLYDVPASVVRDAVRFEQQLLAA